MTNRKAATALSIVPDMEQLDAVLIEASAQTSRMVQRCASHRDRIQVEVAELERERADLMARRDLLRRQVESVEQGINMHIEDIDATIALYPSLAKAAE